MRAFRITDIMIPISILEHDKIASQIYEDGQDFIMPDVISEYWIGIELNGNVFACYRIHAMGAVLWQLHARVLPEYREKYSVRATTLAFKWGAANIPNLEKIMCTIPECHPNVIAHAITIGLTSDGVIKKSYLKSGKVVDTHIYSISKQKIEEL